MRPNMYRGDRIFILTLFPHFNGIFISIPDKHYLLLFLSVLIDNKIAELIPRKSWKKKFENI